MKAHEGGFTWYAASYGSRWSEPLGTFVSLVPCQVNQAADDAAEQHQQDMRELDEEGRHPEGSCHLHGCDICDIQVWAGTHYRTEDLFSPAELRKHRRALLRGEMVHLTRD